MNCQNKIVYKVLPGDTLYKIAQKYKTSLNVILQLNGGLMPHNLQVGSDIIICPNVENLEKANLISLNNEMRLLWEQHVWWTRMLILNIVDGVDGQQETVKRLLKNPEDIARIYSKYYGHDVESKINQLITEHLVIGAALIKAVKENDSIKINDLNSKWYKNADEIADYLASINSFYDKDTLRKMLHIHLELTKQEVMYRIKKLYSDDVTNFERIEQEALMMADYLSNSLYRKFINDFV